MLTKTEQERYSRQIVLPGFGENAQRRLKSAAAFVVGAGGLGSPALLYLAAAGVGRIGFIDDDVVDRSNLHRQTLYTEADLGRRKVDAAAERLAALNPDVHLEPVSNRLTSENALSLLESYDVVLDGTDRFETRYLVNDACVLTGTPNVYGSVFRFEGQVAVFNLRGSGCYRCLFPEPPPAGSVPDCAEGGVLGALPGIVGSIQALEAIKILAEVGEPASDTLLMFDGLTLTPRTMRFRRDAACAVCGDDPSVTELIDYEVFCGIPADPVSTITPDELRGELTGGAPPFLLDVRSRDEHLEYAIGGLLIPLPELELRIREIPDDRPIVAICRSGKRSETAARILANSGRQNVRSLSGGLNAWRRTDASRS
jgi:sulfur-carrier protein adenylyltransferase/sulfurtransferase